MIDLSNAIRELQLQKQRIERAIFEMRGLRSLQGAAGAAVDVEAIKANRSDEKKRRARKSTALTLE